MTVMYQFANIISTLAQDVEQAPRDGPQLARMLIHPGLDGWILLDCTGEPKELVHGYSGCWSTLFAR
jgi:hypothetical protein